MDAKAVDAPAEFKKKLFQVYKGYSGKEKDVSLYLNIQEILLLSKCPRIFHIIMTVILLGSNPHNSME